MPEVQNVGAAEYAQYQPSQYPQEAYNEEYNTQPEVYDESYAQMRAANKSRIGATIISAIIGAGIGAGAYYLGKRSGRGAEVADDAIKTALENVNKELTELKNSEAIRNYDKLKQSAEEVEKFVENKSWYNFFGVKDKIKNAFAFLKEDSKKIAEETAQTADKAKEGAEDAAKKAVDEVKEGAENAA